MNIQLGHLLHTIHVGMSFTDPSYKYVTYNCTLSCVLLLRLCCGYENERVVSTA